MIILISLINMDYTKVDTWIHLCVDQRQNAGYNTSGIIEINNDYS